MKKGPFEFAIIVNEKVMPEYVDPSNEQAYIIADAGIQYKISFSNTTPNVVYVVISIDGKPLYFRYTCIRSILIEGYQDGDSLSPFVFSLSPLVPPPESSDSPSPLPKVDSMGGSITFQIFNSISVQPYEVNTNQQIPDEQKFTPSLTPTKTSKIGTNLGEPMKNVLEKKLISVECGTILLASHSFLVRTPLEMVNSKVMAPCWNHWWMKERDMHCLSNMEWTHPDLSCAATEPLSKEFKAKILQSTSLPALNSALKRIGLVATPGPHNLIEALAIVVCGDTSKVNNCITYFHSKISDRLFSIDYSPIYTPNEYNTMNYYDWTKSNEVQKLALEQPGIILQAFADVFGIPLHVYFLHGNSSKHALQVVNPLKGKRTWFYGYALAYVNQEWHIIIRGPFDLSDDPEEAKQKTQLENDLEELQKEMDRKRKQLEEINGRTRRMKTEQN